MPQVSVIIPAYNASAYVAQAVQSALGQRGVDLEVIVIDDGSTDDTPKVLATFGESIRVVRQSNAGHVKARNHAAQLARGEWLAFLDADDEWLPDKLAKQLQLAEEDTALIYTGRQNFGDCGRIASLQSVEELLEGDVFDMLLLGNFLTVSSVIIRKTWFEQLEGFNAEPYGCEDWDLWLRCAARGGRIRVCREPLTRYRWHTTSMSFNHDRMCYGRFKVLERALALPRSRQAPWSVRRRALAYAWVVSAAYAANNSRWTALKWYIRSLTCWPFIGEAYLGIAISCLRLAREARLSAAKKPAPSSVSVEPSP